MFDYLLLQAPGGNSGMIQLLFFGAMFLIFWFFLIRPQAKRQREQTAFAKALGVGDEVVTASGIIGKINKIDDEIVFLEVSKNTQIRVTRNAISKEMTDALFNTAQK
jgi:preprotein translocase subunit YajC